MEASSVEEFPDREQNNQNTNRNETCAASTCRGNIQSDTKATEMYKPSGESESFQIPTVIITGPPDNGDNLVDVPTQDSTLSFDPMKMKGEQLNMEISANDKTLDAFNGVDTASDDEFEVICGCSSTPLSTNNDSRPRISSLKSDMSSIDDTSPLRKKNDIGTTVEQEGPDSNLGVRYVTLQYPRMELEEPEHNLCLHSEDFGGSQIQNASGYDTRCLASMSQPVPVYNVNGTSLSYASSPANTVTTFSTYSQEGSCQVPIQNGFTVNFSNTNGETQSRESSNSANQDPEEARAECLAAQQPDSYNFVYPSIYVSNAGLISVLLRHDMSVEMTVDRTIRVVSHQHLMAVATDSRGTSACLYHPALKVIQQGTTTDIATDTVRVHMGHDDVAFAIGQNRYRFDAYDIQAATHVKFSDILKDQSVNLLFSSEGYGESLVPHCLQVAAKAEYANLPKGGVIVRINGVKVTQTGGGDVTVVTGAKFIRLSPSFGMTRLGNRFIDIEIEKDWSLRVSRGPHGFLASDRRVIITNGILEVDINEQGRFKVAHLQAHRPVTPQHCLRQPDNNYVRRVNSVTYTASSTAHAGKPVRIPPVRRRSAPVTR